MGVEVQGGVASEALPSPAGHHEGEALRLDRHAGPLDVLLDVPVDEGRLAGRVVPDQHDRDLLPRGEQLEAEGLGDGDEPMLGVGVEGVALLEDALVEGGGGGLQVVGRAAGLRLAGHPLQEY